MSKFNIKFDDNENCKMFLTSDLHLNHKQNFTWAKRGYSSREDHTAGVINKINEICRPTDILFCLGDLCLNTSEEEFYSLIKRINCNIYLLFGNHSNPITKLYRQYCKEFFGHDYEMYGYKWLNKVTIWGQYYEFVWNNQPTILSHYAFAVHNQQHHGSIHACGHSHGNYLPSRPETLNQGKILDVGWDVFAKPIGFKEIMKIMNKKQIEQKDHHSFEVS